MKRTLAVLLALLLAAAAWASQTETTRTSVLALITGTTYYLNFASGNDDIGNGTSGLPWKTIAKALTVVVSGDGVVLQGNSDYGDFDETAAAGRTAYIVWINAEGATPELSRIYLHYGSATNAYHLFYGFKVAADWLDPCDGEQTGCDDPQYAESTSVTYSKSDNPVDLLNANYVQVINCELVGTNKYLTDHGVLAEDGSNLRVEHCNIHATGAGIATYDLATVVLFHNHISAISSTAFKIGDGCSAVTIERNNVHDSNYSLTDDYCPKAEGEEPHGSAVSIRSSGVTIDRNMFHDGFNSAGIMCYLDGDPAQYDDILIKNNLLYDIHVTAVIRFYKCGAGVQIVNNTIAGNDEGGADGRTHFNYAIVLHTVGATDPTLEIYDNVTVGACSVITTDIAVTMKGNIFYSVEKDSAWVCDADDPDNIIKVCTFGAGTTYFESNFFAQAGILFTAAHGNTYDFRLAAGSDGINAGDVSVQSSDSLGQISGAYIGVGSGRNASKHSVGAYEYGSDVGAGGFLIGGSL